MKNKIHYSKNTNIETTHRTSRRSYRKGLKTIRLPLCNLDYKWYSQTGFNYRPSSLTNKVLEVTCKRCLQAIAKRVGLSKEAPVYVIHDFLQERKIEL